MKKSKIFIMVLMVVFILKEAVFAQRNTKSKDDFPVLKSPYLGQKPPGMVPEVFAPGIISRKKRIEFCIAFTPDNREVFYSVRESEKAWSMLCHKQDKSGWGPAFKPEFAKSFSCLEPFVSPDGSRLFFSSNMPLEPGGSVKDYDIWFVQRYENGWGQPVNAGSGVNSENPEWRATCSLRGNLFFSSFGLWKARMDGLGFSDAVKVSDMENPVIIGGHAFIAPDERYILTSWMTGPDARGGWDIYITCKDSNGSWGKSMNIGDVINTGADEDFPYVSPDGKYFFFFRRYKDQNSLEHGDIFWVNAGMIDAFPPGAAK